MKIYLQLFTVFILITSVTSCTKDEINKDFNILGVWEVSNSTDDTVHKQTLVFGENSTGLNIYASEFLSGEKTSSAIAFNWEINGNAITLFEGDTVQNIQIINSDDEVYLYHEDLYLIKISNDYSSYY
ncbi:hypothetical protein RXV94_09780 [Yeosuana sp. MJ-SS3]|uniref:Lipocalin-like domain-containing protein n=1 Tax=Gilvirhabdus luticola TaxID=3079858 RepID=A0ABU3U7R2_9FLAO|nr:hypothetical protein [Yeosuana sp. MJ-SS3]MDU8886449.1 hypothetical protein [Yeosuana sp. MJ-SS3]